MEATLLIEDERYGLPKYAGQRMAKADFLRWQLDDNYVYEFNDGILEPTTGMRQEENMLLKRLTRASLKTTSFSKGGELPGEVDTWLTEKQMHRPDVSFYSNKQL